MRSFDPVRAWELVEEENVTIGLAVPAMLNFSTGAKNIASGCRTARLKIVYSSRRFVRMAKLETTIEAIAATGARLMYLEDLREELPASRTA